MQPNIKKKRRVLAQEITNEEEILKWQAYLRPHFQKSITWFVGAGIVTTGLVTWAILDQNWLAAVIFSILLGMVYLLSTEKPEEVAIKITNMGIYLGEQFFSFQHILSFWIVDAEEIPTLYFDATGVLGGVYRCQLDGQDITDIRNILSNFVQEDLNRGEGLVDTISRVLHL